MTETCATCVHWDRETRREVPAVSRCKAVMQLWDATEWNDDCDRVLAKEAESVLAFVQDGSDYSAKLFTRPEFSCAMHKGEA